MPLALLPAWLQTVGVDCGSPIWINIEVKNEVRCPLVPKFWSIPVLWSVEWVVLHNFFGPEVRVIELLNQTETGSFERFTAIPRAADITFWSCSGISQAPPNQFPLLACLSHAKQVLGSLFFRLALELPFALDSLSRSVKVLKARSRFGT